MRPSRSVLPLPLLLASALWLGGCDTLQRSDGVLGALTPYRVDLVQGNVITREQAAMVRPGMSKAQVRELLGTPLISDPFHAQRWDYLFTLKRQGVPEQRRSVVAVFDGDKLARLEAPDLPSEREFVAGVSRHKDPRVHGLELSEAQRSALPLPPKREPVAPEPTGAVREYPPLEKP